MFIGDDELQKTILGLEFRVGAKHFKDGDMKLKCLASISTIYWKTNEESVKGDKPLIKVLSSQDTSLPNKSRADRVQGKPPRGGFRRIREAQPVPAHAPGGRGGRGCAGGRAEGIA